MALSEFEIKRCEAHLDAFIAKRRPPAHIRPQLDLAYRIEGQAVEIFEIRPLWNKPDELIEIPVAKAKFINTRKIWRVYGQRADLKWHSYEPAAEVARIEDFITVVDEDKYGCFWG